MKSYCVYIMASNRNGTLYVGVTSHLAARVFKHKQKLLGKKSFSAKYDVHKLVYYEVTSDVYAALRREKNIKAWKRSWKLDLIESKNHDWDDLYDEIIGNKEE